MIKVVKKIINNKKMKNKPKDYINILMKKKDI